LDQIFSADFLSKLYKHFGGENWNLPLGGAKDEHFSFFQWSCQLGLSGGHRILWLNQSLWNTS
jgi:hypothetical protein